MSSARRSTKQATTEAMSVKAMVTPMPVQMLAMYLQWVVSRW